MTDTALTCTSCGVPNPAWYADSRLWNEVMGGDPDREAAGFLCPTCFIVRADEYFADTEWKVTGWRLLPDLARRVEEPVINENLQRAGQRRRDTVTAAGGEGDR